MQLTIENRSSDTVYTEQNTDQYQAKAAMDNTKIYDHAVHDFWEVDSWSIDLPGVRFGRYHIDVKEDIYVKTSEPAPLPGLVFIHSGQVSSRFHADSANHTFSSNRHAILFNPFATERTVFKKQKGLDISMVIFHPAYFLKIANDSCPIMDNMMDNILTKNIGNIAYNAHCRITMDMYRILAEISDCPFHGELRNIYLQAKAMELLVLQCTQMDEKRFLKGKQIKLSPDDIAKIYAARDILVENMQDPPSLTQLARLVGINDFKLKAGFKAEFSNSVFGYLNDLRLAIAKKNLLQHNKSLTEIAYETGYSSLAHFSNAFKKKYGLSPIYAKGAV
ncbi:helix-turn-helix transcriptional regulator [Olivibacter sp. SDN3]|uniref:helix-turn-helix transcriptional regulator n=1 Tax=Olivibacter sp. SDN3 TaxID=2764720 RepID=UPI001651A8C3|nr:AraC family transcriptional regulator [Olivibacter sp. SDN3]QNL51989.1 helix-turn-helix transcriptional regulator [Olivibacter sp. SDN3]